MTKLFTAQIVDTLDIIAQRSKSKVVDIASKSATTRTFNMLYKLGTDTYGYNFAKRLSDAKIRDAEDFRELLMSDDFKDELMNDRQGKFLIKKIKYPTKSVIAAEMKAVYDKYKDQMSKDADDVTDPLHTYAIRTQFGDGPVVFVEGIKSEAGRREVRKWYAWMYKVNYFQVRECSFDHWLKHPETQEATDSYEYQNDDLYAAEDKMATDESLIENVNSVNESFDDDGFRRRGGKRRMMDNMKSRRFEKYRKFDDLDDDILSDEYDDFFNNDYDDMDDLDEAVSTEFKRGDMVKKIDSKNDQGFIVIDVLESEADIETARKKRNYRRMLPKDFEASENTPALAVMTMKGHRGGLNYIYPASEFKHIG